VLAKTGQEAVKLAAEQAFDRVLICYLETKPAWNPKNPDQAISLQTPQ